MGVTPQWIETPAKGAAYELLVEFTGKEPVSAVRQRLREQKQADLGEDVLLELYRHRILTDA